MRRTIFALLIAATGVLAACEPAQPQPDAVAKSYADLWQKADYQKMWDLLSDNAKARVGTEGFVELAQRARAAGRDVEAVRVPGDHDTMKAAALPLAIELFRRH